MNPLEKLDRRARLWAHIRQVIEERQQAAEAERERPEAAAAAEAEKRADARVVEITARFQDLAHRYGGEEFRFLEDPAHLADYAKKYMTKLLSQRDKITADYSTFMRDAEFIAYVKDKAPHLLTRAAWEWRALAQARQLDVQQPPAPPIEEKKPERPKLTPEQFTERMVKHFTTKLKDQEVILKAGRAWLEAQEEEILSSIEDEDERENVRQHLQSILGEALQALNQNRKGG